MATILETPGEPTDSTLKDRLFHGAYPIHEAQASSSPIWDRPSSSRPFPVYDIFNPAGLPDDPRSEILLSGELAADPWKIRWTRSHTAFLHTIVSGAVFTEEFGVLPELDFVETPIFMVYVATRRVGDNVWTRMVESGAAQSAAGCADLGGWPRRALIQRADDEPLGRSAR